MRRKAPTDARAAGLLLILWCAGCAAPQAIDAVDLDVADRQRAATAQLATPRTAADGHLDLAWLCLLHGVNCAALSAHAEAAVLGASQVALAQLTRALARQADADVQSRADAWLDLLLWQAGVPSGSDDVSTLALDALARLARRDRVGVRLALAAHPLDVAALTSLGQAALDPKQRLRRLRALATWLPGPALAVTGAAPPIVVQIDKQPFGRRLYADFERVTAGGGVAAAAIALQTRNHGAMDEVVLPLPASPGVYRVRLGWTALAPGRWTLALRASRPFRVWLQSGGARPQRATRRGLEDRTWLVPAEVAADGALRCTVALPLAAEGARLAVVLMPQTPWLGGPPAAPAHAVPARLAPAEAAPAQTSAARTPTLAERVVVAVLASEDAAGAWLAKRFPRGPLASLLALARDPQGAALRQALDRTLDRLPDHVDARIDRAQLARDESQVGLARRLLQPLATQAQDDAALARRSDLQLGIAGLRQVDGLGDLSVAAAERAAAGQPGDCRTYWRAVEVASDALDRDALRRLLATRVAAACRGREPLKHVSMLAAAGDANAAFALLRQTAGRLGWARRARARARAMPMAHAARWAWSDAAAAVLASRASGEALMHGREVMARAAWTRILLGPGATPTQRRGAWLLGARAPWLGLTIDGAAWVKAHPATQVNGAPVTWLLDHEIVVPLPGGGALRRVHQIVRVHTAGAAESVGELNVPANAELLLARTHTADGRIVSPADTPDKESTSLREVTPGAVVEYIQVQFVGASDPATGATRLPVFLLQSRDGPVVESRFEVLDRPAAQPAASSAPVVGGTVRVDVSAAAPAPTTSTHGGWRVRQWRLQNAPRFHLEPRANRAAWQLAAVHASVGATLESVVGPWADILAGQAARPAPALNPWITKARAAGDDLAKWRTLIADVAARVSDKTAGLRPGSPAAAVRNGQGDRAALLFRLARSAGVQACFVRVRPWSRQPAHGALDPADFSLNVLTLRLRGPSGLQQVWIDPAVDGVLLNYLRPGLRGRPAVRIGCDPALPVQFTTPDLGAAEDRRVVDIDLVWQADGAVHAEVEDTLRGVLATVVRNVLRAGSKDQRLAVLRQLSSATFPGMTPAWLGVTGLAATGSHPPGSDALGATPRPLVLRYRVTAEAAGHRRTRLILGLVPYRLGRRYAALARRKMTLRFGHQLDVAVTLRVRSAAGALLLPQSTRTDNTKAQLTQTASLRRGALHVTHTLRSQMGLVTPADYVAFASTLRAIDRAEMLILRRAPTVGTAPR